MRIIESCAKCLYDKQKHLTDNQEYLAEIKEIIDNRGEEDTSPFLVYRFALVYEKYFGKRSAYGEIKKKFNDLVLSMEHQIAQKIEAADDPVRTALAYARVGNYIDFGAMKDVEEEVFLSLLEDAKWNERETHVYESFIAQCETAKKFLLISDNCGEIVLDKLFLKSLKKRFPNLSLTVLVRGSEVLNDATPEDAAYVGIDQVANVISNGMPIAGTVYDMLPDDAKSALDEADVILAKGQGNYESLSRQERHIFYSFLCKCELFTERFSVPKLVGVFVEEMN